MHLKLLSTNKKGTWMAMITCRWPLTIKTDYFFIFKLELCWFNKEINLKKEAILYN